MSNKIVWREGTFLYPQHFQQMESHLENVTQQYSALTTSEFAPHCGLAQLSINEGLLKLGQFSVVACEGILPDGQYFKLDQEVALHIPEGTIDQMVYLVVPANLAGNNSFDNGYRVLAIKPSLIAFLTLPITKLLSLKLKPHG